MIEGMKKVRGRRCEYIGRRKPLSNGNECQMRKGVWIIKQLFFLDFGAIVKPKSSCHYIRHKIKNQKQDYANDFAHFWLLSHTKVELISHSCFFPIVNPLHLTVCCSFNSLNLPPRTFSLSGPYFYALKPLPPSPCRVVQFFTASLVVLMTLSPLSSFFSFFFFTSLWSVTFILSLYRLHLFICPTLNVLSFIIHEPDSDWKKRKNKDTSASWRGSFLPECVCVRLLLSSALVKWSSFRLILLQCARLDFRMLD